MDKDTKPASGNLTITIILIGVFHLVAFGWLAYSTDRMLYKIFFGIMGFLLFFGIVDKIRGKSIEDKDKEEPTEN